MNKKTVSILGCGWLGVPLARHLISKNFLVKGSVTTPEKFEILRSAGISPFRVKLSPEEIEVDNSDFFDCEVLIISLPPRRVEGIVEIFPAQISQLISTVLKFGIPKVIFISSTSVYPENLQVAKENDLFTPDKESGKALLKAEKLLENNPEFKTTILRFGGLIGTDRNPARFLLKSVGEIANTPVNLIHQDDCIGIISEIVDKELWGETLNACCPDHPMKKDFYQRAAMLSGLSEPRISVLPESYKVVDSSKLIRLLNYRFKYPSPMDYLETLQ